MASSANANRLVQSAFAGAFSEATSLAARVAGPAVLVPGAAAFEVGDLSMGGIGQTLSRTATSLSPSDWFTYATSFPMAHKVVKHTVKRDTLTSDYAFENAGRKLAESAMATLDKGFFDGLEGLFSAAHPRVGTGAGQVGSGKYYLDASKKYLQGESGEGTYTDLGTSALDETSLNVAIKALLDSRTDRGVPLHIGANGGLVLVCSPKNAKVAHELVKSQLSGSDNASNFVNGLISDIIVYPLTTDDDDWFLVSKQNCPIGLAISQEPVARIAPTTDGLFVDLIAEVSYTFWRSPYEHGIYGANVA